MKKTQLVELYDKLFYEGLQGYYAGGLTELNKTAYLIGNLERELDAYDGLANWIRSGWYEDSYSDVKYAIDEAVCEGLTELESLSDALSEVNKIMKRELGCGECGGTGMLPENEEYGFVEEQCDICYGKGYFKSDKNRFDSDDVGSLSYELPKSREVFAKVVLVQLSEPELKELQLKTKFN